MSSLYLCAHESILVGSELIETFCLHFKDKQVEKKPLYIDIQIWVVWTFFSCVKIVDSVSIKIPFCL